MARCRRTWSARSHYLNQCWNIVNCTLRNKLQWNVNQNFYIFIQENACENVVCEKAAILSGAQPLLTQPWPVICLSTMFMLWLCCLLCVSPVGASFAYNGLSIKPTAGLPLAQVQPDTAQQRGEWRPPAQPWLGGVLYQIDIRLTIKYQFSKALHQAIVIFQKRKAC